MYRESRNCLVLRLRIAPIVVVVAGYVKRGTSTVVVKFEVRDGRCELERSPCAKVCAPLREKAWQIHVISKFRASGSWSWSWSSLSFQTFHAKGGTMYLKSAYFFAYGGYRHNGGRKKNCRREDRTGD